MTMRRFAAISLVTLAVIVAAGLAVERAAAQQNFDAVQMKAERVNGNVWMITGAGGNIGVSAGPDGTLIIDDQYAPLAEKIRAALKELNATGSLKFIVNTHWHGDHTGSNPVFGQEAPIIAHANVRERLKTGAPARKVPPMDAKGWPVITFEQGLSIHFNGEEIKAIHFPRGHTDGDSVIFFTGSNVVHMGDDFFAGHFPFVDLNSGGSVEGLTKNIGEVLAKLPAGTKLIPGHGPVSSLDDLKAYHAMLVETTEHVRAQIKAGKTLEQVKAAGMPAKYKDWAWNFLSGEAWAEAIFRSLTGDKPRSQALPPDPTGHGHPHPPAR